MKAFLFVFDPSRIGREAVIRQIDRMPDIKNWYAFFGNTMCFASELDSQAISRLVRDAFIDLRFIVTEVNPNEKAGWLPQPVWSFLNDPHESAAEVA